MISPYLVTPSSVHYSIISFFFMAETHMTFMRISNRDHILYSVLFSYNDIHPHN